MKVSILGVAVFAIAPSLAFAQGGSQQVLVGGGLGVTAPASTLGDRVDSSVALDGFGVIPVRGMWSLRVDAGYDRFRLAQQARNDCSAHGFECRDRVGHVDAGLQVSARRSAIRPYGFFELGIYNFKQEGESGSALSTTTSTNWGGGFGAGVVADLTGNWGVGAALSTRFWRQGEASATQSYWFLEPTAFACYRFGPY